jgi:hypothetical protein
MRGRSLAFAKDEIVALVNLTRIRSNYETKHFSDHLQSKVYQTVYETVREAARLWVQQSDKHQWMK